MLSPEICGVMADNLHNLQPWYACKLKVLTQLIFESNLILEKGLKHEIQ